MRNKRLLFILYALIRKCLLIYSGTSVVDHNSFEFVGRKPICSKTETLFPIRNNGKYFNPLYPPPQKKKNT